MTVSATSRENLPDFRLLPLSKLFVDKLAGQRDLIEPWLEHLRSEWNIAKAGVLMVSAREDGSFHVIDGGHRLVVLRELGITSHWCEIHYGLTIEEEADMFLGRNDVRPVNGIHKFHARVVKGEPNAVAIRNVLAIYGVAVGFQAHGQIRNYQCVRDLFKIHEDGTLLDVIHLIETAWGDEFGKAARGKVAVDAVGLFVANYRQLPVYSTDRAVKQFSAMKLKSSLIRARDNAVVTGNSQRVEFAKILRDIYNRGAKNRLPEIVW